MFYFVARRVGVHVPPNPTLINSRIEDDESRGAASTTQEQVAESLF